MTSFLRWSLTRHRGYRVDHWPGMLYLQMRRRVDGVQLGVGRAIGVDDLEPDWRPRVAATIRQLRTELRLAA